MAVYDIVETTTGPVQFQLLENGTAINLTGLGVSILIENKDGTALSSPGTVAVTDAANGKIQFTPTGATTFIASNGPYYVRWLLTTPLGAVSFVPTSNRDVWNIVGK